MTQIMMIDDDGIDDNDYDDDDGDDDDDDTCLVFARQNYRSCQVS